MMKILLQFISTVKIYYCNCFSQNYNHFFSGINATILLYLLLVRPLFFFGYFNTLDKDMTFQEITQLK